MKTLAYNQPPSSIRFAPHLSPSTGPTDLAIWFDRQRQRIHLSRLDDIAVSRIEAVREARRWD